jgi:DNA-binding transcriptional LysR family regulator
MTASADDVMSMVLFARVVEERSFTAAATRLGMSKSAVSAQVARFEERLGTRLLHRTTRRLSLTDAGLALYQRCARIAAEADEAAALAQGLGQVPQGLLRVNASSTFAARHLAPAVRDFLALHPQVTVEFGVEDRFVDVTHGGYDVVVRIARKGQMTADPSVTARRLATDRLVVCAAPSYLAARGRPQTLEELVEHQCLRYTHNTPHEEWRFERDGTAAYIPVPSAFACNSGEVLYAAALAGTGLAILPGFLVAEALDSGALVEVLPGFSAAELGVWALYPGRRHVPARVRAFVDFLAARFRKGLSAALSPAERREAAR